ncbi:MAG: NAD-dependent epimerase/dehydratase family protein [Firmicutes bacterium]|nr:NAD-dependent epimerase/dehydratase family protein [Bacillota bacterium]
MNILVTGARGFIGRNLVEKLKGKKGTEILKFDRGNDPEELARYCSECDFLFHFAAVHRPLHESEFENVNHMFFATLLERLRVHDNRCPVLLTSSIQSGEDTAYGRSKVAAENELKKHAEMLNSKAIIYRLTNTFGRYARPNHHSVVATFCHNIARGLPIVISDPDRVMHLYYIDDVIASFVSHLDNGDRPEADGYYRLPEELRYDISLVKLADMLYSFKACLDEGLKPSISDEFMAKLYETYLSYTY